MKQVRQWFQYKRQKARPGGKYGSSTSGLSEAVLAFKVGGSARGCELCSIMTRCSVLHSPWHLSLSTHPQYATHTVA